MFSNQHFKLHKSHLILGVVDDTLEVRPALDVNELPQGGRGGGDLDGHQGRVIIIPTDFLASCIREIFCRDCPGFGEILHPSVKGLLVSGVPTLTVDPDIVQWFTCFLLIIVVFPNCCWKFVKVVFVCVRDGFWGPVPDLVEFNKNTGSYRVATFRNKAIWIMSTLS